MPDNTSYVDDELHDITNNHHDTVSSHHDKAVQQYCELSDNILCSESVPVLSKKLSLSSLSPSKSSDSNLQRHQNLERYFGLLLAFVSGILMTAYSSLIKFLDEMDVMQVVAVRGFLQLVIMGSVAKYNQVSFTVKDSSRIRILLLLVTLTGGLRIFFVFVSFSRLPLGDSTTILFSSPIVVMVLSMFMLGEKCGIFRMVAATSLLGGVILIAKPPIMFGLDDQEYDALGI